MTERLTRLRGPAVLALLVVLTLRILLAVTGFALHVGGSTSSREAAAAAAAAAATDPLTVVVLAVLLGSCVLGPPVPAARTYRSWALAVVGLGAVVSLAAAVVWLVARPAGGATLLDAGQLLLRLVLPVLVLVALARLRFPAAGTQPAAGTAPAALEAASTETEPEPAPDPAQEPVWQPDQAAGAAWMKAGDAAAGAAASGWGSAADAGGWSPQVRDGQSSSTSSAPPAMEQPRPDAAGATAVRPDAPTEGPSDAARAPGWPARPDRPDSNVADRYRPRDSSGPV